jgi:hypothetical protein
LAAFHRAKSRAASLLVFVDVDACAVFDAVEVFFGELAVLGEAGDAEVPGAVLGLVGDVFGCEFFDERDHLRNAGGGVLDVLGVLDAEGVEVFEEGALEFRGVLGDGDAGGGGGAGVVVVEVDGVHEVEERKGKVREEAGEDIDVEEGKAEASRAVRRRWGRSSTCAVRVRRLGRGFRSCRPGC